MVNDEEFIEWKARVFRQELGIEGQLRPDIPTVIYKLKNRDIITDYRRVPDEEMPTDEAYFDTETRVLHIRESVFCAANAAYTFDKPQRQRARFTLAHEIGHIVLGHPGIRFRGPTAKLVKRASAQVRREENEADRFAAAFLAPAYLISDPQR